MQVELNMRTIVFVFDLNYSQQQAEDSQRTRRRMMTERKIAIYIDVIV